MQDFGCLSLLWCLGIVLSHAVHCGGMAFALILARLRIFVIRCCHLEDMLVIYYFSIVI
jgi:hypothetical protein